MMARREAARRAPALGLLLLALALPAAGQTLVLSTNALPPRSSPEGRGYFDRVISLGLGGLGYRMEIVRFPSERGLDAAAKGEIDGVYARTAGLEASYPGLVMVPGSIGQSRYVAFTLVSEPPFGKFEELRNREVGLVRGWKILEARTADFPRLTLVKDEEAAFRLLLGGRIEALLYEREDGQSYLGGIGKGAEVSAGPILLLSEQYLYLNKRHAALAAALGERFRGFAADGSIARITAEAQAQAGAE